MVGFFFQGFSELVPYLTVREIFKFKFLKNEESSRAQISIENNWLMDWYKQDEKTEVRMQVPYLFQVSAICPLFGSLS